MNLQQILSFLEHPNPTVRLDTARVLGMVYETEAIDKLKAAYERETDEETKQVMAWAGKRIVNAHKEGYRILDDIFEHFNLNKELHSHVSPAELELLRKMERQLTNDLNSIRQRGTITRAGMSIAGGAVLGGIAGASFAIGNMMRVTKDVRDSDSSRSGYDERRTPPMRPTSSDTSVWIHKLQNEQDPRDRRTAITELMSINNPNAMPALFNAHLTDPVDQIRDAAYNAGRLLYLRMRYWHLTQDGTIDAEFERRSKEIQAAASDLNSNTTQARPVDPAAQQASAEEVARILMEARRKKQNRR
ncbi:MAG: HEAT repeat domain-containing protein [Chloroflexi bacterium]|nr:HEAT repeat domain-containing protein [Chloroflexota bacterium]